MKRVDFEAYQQRAGMMSKKKSLLVSIAIHNELHRGVINDVAEPFGWIAGIKGNIGYILP